MNEAILNKRRLDFSDCKYIGEVYAVIKKELELPERCGENLDALWDAITGIMFTPVQITINPTSRRKELQAAIDDIVGVFREAEDEYHEIVVVIEE